MDSAIDPSARLLDSNRDDILLEFNLDLLQRGVPAGRFEPFLCPGARSFSTVEFPYLGARTGGPSALELYVIHITYLLQF